MTSSRHFIYLIISFYIYLYILYIAGLQWFSNYGTQTIVVSLWWYTWKPDFFLTALVKYCIRHI